jgi:membrane-bound ClpP family serine protease
MLNPEGHVFVDGSLGRARAPEVAGKVKTGTVVRVVGLDDRLTLEVAVDDDGGGGDEVGEPDGAAPAGVG